MLPGIDVFRQFDLGLVLVLGHQPFRCPGDVPDEWKEKGADDDVKDRVRVGDLAGQGQSRPAYELGERSDKG